MYAMYEIIYFEQVLILYYFKLLFRPCRIPVIAMQSSLSLLNGHSMHRLLNLMTKENCITQKNNKKYIFKNTLLINLLRNTNESIFFI